jgi:DNA-binding transcriptional LysR family regulator
MNLDALADFVLVATHGGLGKAARDTGRSKATLSRKVSELEDALQVRLVERGATQLRLTAEGEALFARTRGLVSELTQAGDDIRNGGSQLSGLLRITAPMLFSHVALSRAAAEFSQLHPQVQIEINAEDRFVDPVEEGYDLVIRTNPKPNENMVGRRLFIDELALVAAPSVTNPGGGPVNALLMSRVGEPRDWVIDNDGAEVTYQPQPVMRLSSILMIREAVQAGRGAAVLPWSLVADDVATGRLSSWGRVLNRPIEVWVLHASSRLSSPKVTSFASFLVGKFSTGRLEVTGIPSLQTAMAKWQ